MVCVLMSTYNGERYLEEQLDSLVRQEGVEIRILIRDDGSNDSTVQILRRWQAEYPRIIELVQEENIGFAMSFTRLLQMGVERYPETDYYAFSDQDDVWLPEKLLRAVEKLEMESKDIPVTYCSNTRLVDANLHFKGMRWRKGEVRLTKERALIQGFATGCTMVFNRKAAEIYISHLPEVIKLHDFLMYQLCMFLGKVVYDENSYILYRQHGGNQIGHPGAWQRWKHRFTRHYQKHVLEQRNFYFLKAYKNLLCLDDIQLIAQMAFYRRNMFTRLSLIFNTKIRYTRV